MLRRITKSHHARQDYNLSTKSFSEEMVRRHGMSGIKIFDYDYDFGKKQATMGLKKPHAQTMDLDNR